MVSGAKPLIRLGYYGAGPIAADYGAARGRID